MYCPADCFELADGVRLRPVPEAGACLAYTPARPALHRLNPTGWLLVSLCDGRRFDAILAGYRAATGRATEPAELGAALGDLVSLGVVRVAAGHDPHGGPG